MKDRQGLIMDDTIAAVCTPLGNGAIGIVRISGAQALTIAENLFCAASGRAIKDYPVNTLIYGHVVDETHSYFDEVMAVYMKGPKSYTAEDVVEIQSHGGVRVLYKILECAYRLGARAAEPGEFTKRAFLNGRIDLAQAEAVMSVIKARSEAALKVAASQQRGELSGVLQLIRKAMLDLISSLEAGIDYPEDDIEEVTYQETAEVIEQTRLRIEKLLSNAHTGRILREGLRTVIVGRPNVGKSSLLNALLQEERAIVSEFAGTTRDLIEEEFLLAGVPLVLVDTAGIRQTEDYIEGLGVARTRRVMQDAELVLMVLDGSQPLCAEDWEILHALKGRSYVIIINKNDLAVQIEYDKLTEQFESDNIVELSTQTGAGMDKLKEWLQQFVYGKGKEPGAEIYVQDARHEQSLRAALVSLADAGRAVAEELPYDCIIIDLRAALEQIGAITGDAVAADIINEIFARFCVGK